MVGEAVYKGKALICSTDGQWMSEKAEAFTFMEGVRKTLRLHRIDIKGGGGRNMIPGQCEKEKGKTPPQPPLRGGEGKAACDAGAIQKRKGEDTPQPPLRGGEGKAACDAGTMRKRKGGEG